MEACCSAAAPCPECAVEAAFVATADMMRPTSREESYATGYVEARCLVCKVPFRAYADYETLCADCQHHEDVAQESEHDATALLIKAQHAAERAAEDRRVAQMTPVERAHHYYLLQAEDDHMQDVLL